jgi:acyl carrier protein
MDARGDIHQIAQELLTRIGDNEPLADDESLFLSGRLQSIDLVEIAILLEERFGIDFGEIGFDREQLDSIDAIYALIESTKSKQA